MAAVDQGEASCHRGVGYAPAGYPPGPGSHGGANRRHRTPAFELCQTEREFNRQRQAEGIAAAKAKGVHFGRKFKDRGENYESVMAAWRRGEISGRAAAKELGVAHGTFQLWCKE